MAIYYCPHCKGEIIRLPPDAIDYCPECEVITEGETIEEEDEHKIR